MHVTSKSNHASKTLRTSIKGISQPPVAVPRQSTRPIVIRVHINAIVIGSLADAAFSFVVGEVHRGLRLVR